MITHIIYILTILIVAKFFYSMGQTKRDLELYDNYQEQVEKQNEPLGIDIVINKISDIPDRMRREGKVYKPTIRK